MAACDNILVRTCLRMPKDVFVSVASEVNIRTTERHGVCPRHVYCVCERVHACLRSAFIPDLLFPNKNARRPLMLTTHRRHSVSPSWSTLFSPIPLEDYSRVPPASPAWLSSTSHIDRANIKHCFFLGLFTHRQRRRRKNHKTFHLWVKSICLCKCSCWCTVNASSPSSLFSSWECCGSDWCAGRLVIDRLTGIHNAAWGKAHRTFFSHLASRVNLNMLKL